jgi:hypothetical protein
MAESGQAARPPVVVGDGDVVVVAVGVDVGEVVVCVGVGVDVGDVGVVVGVVVGEPVPEAVGLGLPPLIPVNSHQTRATTRTTTSRMSRRRSQ